MKLELDKFEKGLILNNLNEDGKLPCAKAFGIARKLKVDSFDMAEITENLNIKIGECELGVFGKKKLKDRDENLYKKIYSYSEENKVTCTKLWEEAKESKMINVRSTIKNSDIKVTYCQLGCFKEGMKHGRKS